jgi:hypothetical protein
LTDNGQSLLVLVVVVGLWFVLLSSLRSWNLRLQLATTQ